MRHTEGSREIYAQRKETIERVFADMKEKHGMRWTTLRGLEKVTMQAMLTFVAMNLKKLATWLWCPQPDSLAEKSEVFVRTTGGTKWLYSPTIA